MFKLSKNLPLSLDFDFDFVIPAPDDSLKFFGILKGDLVFCSTESPWNGDLCVIDTASDGFLIGEYQSLNGSGEYVVHCRKDVYSNLGDDSVTLGGVIRAIVRKYDVSHL